MADHAGRSASHALLYFRAVRQDGEVTPCLQKARRLPPSVADLGLCAKHDRLERRLVGGRCGQHCGQRSVQPALRRSRFVR